MNDTNTSAVAPRAPASEAIEPCFGQCGIADLRAQLTSLTEAVAQLRQQQEGLVQSWRGSAHVEEDLALAGWLATRDAYERCANELEAALPPIPDPATENG